MTERKSRNVARLLPAAVVPAEDRTLAAALRALADAFHWQAERDGQFERLFHAIAERLESTPAPRPYGMGSDGRLYLTLAEAAAATRVNKRTLGRWCQAGKLAAIRPGGPTSPWRIPVAELERLHELLGDVS